MIEAQQTTETLAAFDRSRPVLVRWRYDEAAIDTLMGPLFVVVGNGQQLGKSASSLDLLAGAALLPTFESDISYNPLVLRDIIDRATDAADAHVSMLSRLGFLA